MLLRIATSIALMVAAATSAVAAVNAMNPASWLIGPIIEGRDYSRGVPLHPTAGPGHAWHIDIPPAPGSVHYATFHHGSLAGKRSIVMHYRIETAPGARIVPATAPQLPAIVTLYFQRRGDDWSGEGRYEAYRWYATFASQSPITPGDHVMIAPLSGNWTAVERSSARTNPGAFADALVNADQVGFVLGGGDGYGHGIFATGPARLIVTEFGVD